MLYLSAVAYYKKKKPRLELALQPDGRRGKPPKHGHHLSIDDDFVLSDEKVGDYYIGVFCVLINIFGASKVLAYITVTEKNSKSKRLFFSTVFPE